MACTDVCVVSVSNKDSVMELWIIDISKSAVSFVFCLVLNIVSLLWPWSSHAIKIHFFLECQENKKKMPIV